MDIKNTVKIKIFIVNSIHAHYQNSNAYYVHRIHIIIKTGSLITIT